MVDPTPIDTVDCDFLIVGAGSSGCVLASRLVRQGLKVLLVEKGTTDAGKIRKLVSRPSDWLRAAMSGNELSEVFMTEPQAGLGNRRLPAFRGRGGGGTSNINSGLYCRGRKKDYEENWPWKLEDIETSFKSIEAELVLEELPTTGTIAPSCDRMLEEIGFERANSRERDASSTQEVSEEPTWTEEGLGGCPMKRTTTRGGERQSAWSAFVSPVTAMPNLRIKDDAVVSRVIIEGGRAVGVEVSEIVPSWRGGVTRVRQLRVKDTAEIVLCCGAFRSPKLLMLSGVGPREHLEEKGVPVIVDMPHVGQNLQDHTVLITTQFSKPPMLETDYTEDSIHGQTYFSCELPVPPLVTGNSVSGVDGDGSSAGAVSSQERPPSAVVGFLYSDGGSLSRNLPYAADMLLPREGIIATAVRALVIALCWIVTWLTLARRILLPTRGALLVVTTIKSRGTVRLASKDAAAPPLIDPGYLSHPQDQQAVCECWRTFRRAKRETVTGKAVFGSEILPGKRYDYGNDDESFLRFARDNCLPYFHPVGTCRMGKGVEDSVVSAGSLRVHGVSGLRVADASVAPLIPSTPTQAMAMMIGDRAASIALSERTAKDQVQARLVEAAGRSVN